MAIDPYQPCPCGSGKKLKFCCPDIAGDMEKIYRMLDGDQPHAALRHVENTLAKHPGRSSLLDLQGVILLSLGEPDKAAESAEQLLATEPNSPTTHALLALVHSAKEDVAAATESLQTALEMVEQNLPQRVLEAVGAVGHSLLVSGELMAARGHLWLYQAIAGNRDTRAAELLLRMNRMAGLPLLLRDTRGLLPLPDDHPAAEGMTEIRQLASVGQWRKAAEKCDELLPDHLDEPTFFYNRALLSGFLADTKNLVAGLRLYARQPDVDHDAAVESEAIAQLLDESKLEPLTTAVRLAYELPNEEACIERLIDSPLAAPFEVQHDEETDGPPPRAAFLLLDRPQPAEPENIDRKDVPQILGLISIYGRRTDREERLEMVADRDDRYEQTVAALRELLGEQLGEEIETEELDNAGSGDRILSWRWHFSPQTPPAVRRRLQSEERRVRLFEMWPDHPRVALDGKTPREAAADDQFKLGVEAAVLVLEHASTNREELPWFNELRETLGLPVAASIDAAEVKLEELPICRLHRVDLSAATDEQLLRAYRNSTLADASEAIHHLAQEILRRGGDLLTPDVFEQLFTAESDSERAIQILEQARKWCDERGESHGRWDLLELQVHILDQNADKAQSLLRHIEAEHGNEPEIAQQLYQLLQMLGVYGGARPGEPAPPAPPMQPSPGAEDASGIWTPEGTSSSEEPSQKLWLPS